MPNWKELLVRYGQNQLWNDTAREFDSFEQNSQRLLEHSPVTRARDANEETWFSS